MNRRKRSRRNVTAQSLGGSGRPLRRTTSLRLSVRPSFECWKWWRKAPLEQRTRSRSDHSVASANSDGGAQILRSAARFCASTEWAFAVWCSTRCDGGSMSRVAALLPLVVFGSPRLTSRVRLRRANPCRSDDEARTAAQSRHPKCHREVVCRRGSGLSAVGSHSRHARSGHGSCWATWEERFTCFEKH